MKAAIITSVSHETPWASLTTPNHAEYCQRHGYTHIARHLPYADAVRDFDFISSILRHFKAVWCLDSDAVITNMAVTLDELPLRPGMNVCEEGLHAQCPINCGSVIWVKSFGADSMLWRLREAEPEWRSLTWIWQQWIAEHRADGSFADYLTVHPARTFNSCHHGDRCLWRPGDLVYHPCGMPHPERLARIRELLQEVQR